MEKLGQMGDVVRVKPGFARNYLLPEKKALRATKENIAYFETQRTQLEAVNLDRRKEAETVGQKLDGLDVTLIRQAGDTGQLYGSVTTRDIADALIEAGFTVARRQIDLNQLIKTLGITDVAVALHPEVKVTVHVNVARSEDEAARQRRGEVINAVGETVESEEEAEMAEKPESGSLAVETPSE